MELDEATTSTAASRVSKASVSQATDIRAPGTRKCAPASVATEAAAGAALEPTERVATASPTASDRVAGAAADAASALVGAGAASPPLSSVSGAWVIEAAVTGASVSQAMDA